MSVHETEPLLLAMRRKWDISLQLFTKRWLDLFQEMLKMTRDTGYILFILWTLQSAATLLLVTLQASPVVLYLLEYENILLV
jgi:hypothetical protein